MATLPLRSLALRLLLSGLVLVGCGGTENSTDPHLVCAGVGAGLDKTCEKAIPVAAARLGGLHLPVTAVRWNLGMCGEGMQCFEGNASDFGWVIFQFTLGDPVMIHVSSVRQADGSGFELVADAQQVPPSWVIEFLDGTPQAHLRRPSGVPGPLMRGGY